MSETMEDLEEQQRAAGSKLAARETRRFYNDLVEAGFDKADALQIVVAWTNRPLVAQAAQSVDMLEAFARALKED